MDAIRILAITTALNKTRQRNFLANKSSSHCLCIKQYQCCNGIFRTKHDRVLLRSFLLTSLINKLTRVKYLYSLYRVYLITFISRITNPSQIIRKISEWSYFNWSSDQSVRIGLLISIIVINQHQKDYNILYYNLTTTCIELFLNVFCYRISKSNSKILNTFAAGIIKVCNHKLSRFQFTLYSRNSQSPFVRRIEETMPVVWVLVWLGRPCNLRGVPIKEDSPLTS